VDFLFQSKSEVELLEEKQSRILQKLDELKQTLISMRGDLNVCNKPSQQKSTATSASGVKKPIDVSNLSEVVINSHPSNVPFSILALKTLWSGRLNVSVEVFTHSSVQSSECTAAAKDFTQKVSVPIAQNNLPTLKVTIIWKDVETTQMLTSASKFIPIYGEVNIIRYFNRIGPSEFGYENDSHFATLSDGTLDICSQLSKKLPVKERQAYVQQLSQRLGKNQFFNNSSSLNVSDVAVSSTLKKLFSGNLKEMPANLSSWLQKLSSIAGY
jgi:Thioredoxin-like domain